MQSNLQRNSLKTKESSTHKVTHNYEALGRNLVVTNGQSRLTSHGFLIDTLAIRNVTNPLKTKRGGRF